MSRPLKSSIKHLKESFDNLKQELEAKVAISGDNQAHNINFKGQTDIQVSKNIGQPGGTAFSNSIQDTQIDQDSSR